MIVELYCDLCGMKVLNSFDDQQTHIIWHDEICEMLGMPIRDTFTFSIDRPHGPIGFIDVLVPDTDE
jgi:hypothetical protein